MIRFSSQNLCACLTLLWRVTDRMWFENCCANRFSFSQNWNVSSLPASVFLGRHSRWLRMTFRRVCCVAWQALKACSYLLSVSQHFDTDMHKIRECLASQTHPLASSSGKLDVFCFYNSEELSSPLHFCIQCQQLLVSLWYQHRHATVTAECELAQICLTRTLPAINCKLEFICEEIFLRRFANVRNRKKYDCKKFRWLYSDSHRDEFSQKFFYRSFLAFSLIFFSAK